MPQVGVSKEGFATIAARSFPVKFQNVKFKDPKFKHEIFVRIQKHSFFSIS